MSGRAAFLDRDGVLVETLVRDGRAHAAVTLEQFRICPEAREQVGAAPGGRAAADRLHQPARGRPRHPPPRHPRAHARAAARGGGRGRHPRVRPRRTARAAPAGSRGPGMLEAAARKWGLDLAGLVRGRRPVAGHRRGTRGRLLHGAHRAPLQRVRESRTPGWPIWPARSTRCWPGQRISHELRRPVTSRRPRRWPPGIDHAAVASLVDLLADARDGGGRLFVLGVGGQRRQRLARGQRLPEDRGLRGLRAHRQRVGAHRPDQRRRLGHRRSPTGSR